MLTQGDRFVHSSELTGRSDVHTESMNEQNVAAFGLCLCTSSSASSEASS